jgi:predicted RNase H-like HicB family nuclease
MVSYKVILERDEEEECYIATVPALPGCHTQGKTREEALERVKEAIQGYLESLQKDGIPIPKDVELEEVAVPV